MKKFFFISLIVCILIGAAPLPEEDLPDYAFVEGLVGHGQAYPLSCESRSAADLAGYWGIPVSETTFFEQLPKSDNPEVGFVGSVYGTWGQTPPNPYGVHAQPIANLLREYGLNAQAQKGFTVKDIKAEIAKGRPVMVWVIGRVWSGTAQTYTANDGSEVTVAAYEHSMIAYGYDNGGNLTSFTDIGGLTTYYDYDAEHNLTTITDPAGRQSDQQHRCRSCGHSSGQRSGSRVAPDRTQERHCCLA